MMTRKLLLIFIFFIPSLVTAQTTVNLSVVDTPDGQSWNNGTWSVVISTIPGGNPPAGAYRVNIGGGSVSPQNGVLSGTGTASLALPANSNITPAQSIWNFQVCPQGTPGPSCFTQGIIVTTSSPQTVSLIPPSIRVDMHAANPPFSGYADGEFTGVVLGATYYNLTSQLTRVCQTVVGNLCTLWANNAGVATLPGGSPIQTQVNNSGVFGGTPCQSFGNIITGPVNNDCDTHFKGPNPYVDASRFGVRAVAPNSVPAIPGITANCSSGSPNVTISSASTFQNGDGVVLYGCGSDTIAAPAAPTVTPSLSAAQTGMLLDVNAPAGAATYCYQLVARSLLGATNVSPETCTNTGPASLGLQTVTLTSASLTNNVATYITSSPHGLAVGAHIIVQGMSVPLAGGASISFTGGSGSALASVNPFNGWFTVATVPDNTHFTVNLLADTRNGSISTGTGGNVNWWNDIRIAATETTNNYQYYVYGRVTGGTKTLIGVMWPQNHALPADSTYLVFQDFGTTVTTAPNVPSYIPTTVPVSAANGMLSTTIVSGAGTTSLVLASSAGNTASGATILFDDAINFVTAAVAATNTAAGTSGPLMLPWPGSANLYFVFNSPLGTMTTPFGAGNTSGVMVLQKGSVWLNEPIIASNLQWYGQPTSNNFIPGFSFTAGETLAINKASPGIYAQFNVYFSELAWALQSSNGAIGFIQDSGGIPAAGTFRNLALQLCPAVTCFSNMGMVFRGGDGWDFQNTSVLSSQNAGQGFPFTGTTPGIYFNQFLNSHFRNLTFSGQTIASRINPAGGFMHVYNVYSQAAYEPYFTFTGAGVNMALTLDGVTFDTTNVPLIANYGGSVLNARITSTLAAGPDILVTGSFPPGGSPRTTVDLIGSFGIGASGKIGSAVRSSSVFTRDGIFGPTSLPIDIFNKSVSVGTGYSIFTTTGSNVAPTCPVSAGGSVTVGTYFYYYVPIYPNGSEGSWSQFCTATTTGGNQTVTLSWTAIPGVTQYNIYQGATQNGINFCQSVTGTTLVFNNGGTCNSGSNTASGFTSSGPAGMQNSLAWAQTQQLGLTSETSVASAPKSTTWPNASGAVVLSSYQNSVYDNFNRADGGVGSNWTAVTGTFNVATNQVKANAGNDNVSFWSANTFPAQGQFAEVAMSVLGARSGPTVYTTATGGYACVENTTALAIFNVVNGNLQSQLATQAITGVNGDVIRLEVVPGATPNLNCYQNGVLTVTATDGQFTSGSPGLDIFNTSVRADNWSGGFLHPISQLDMEQDWTQPQHFVVPVTVGPTSPVAGTLQPGITSRAYNGTQMADTFAGADASIKTNACIAAVIAVGGGKCDASGLTGAQIISQEIDVGNHAQVPVTLILPEAATWTVTGITNGTSCAVKQFSQSSIIGPGTGGSGGMRIHGGLNTNNIDSLYCTEAAPTGNGSYIRAEGFQLYNPNTATMVNGAMNVQAIFDDSDFRDVVVASYGTVGINVHGLVCCGATFTNVTSNGNFVAGSIPVKINIVSTGVAPAFYSLSADHPGSGLNAIQISVTNHSGAKFYNIYSEGNNDLATANISVSAPSSQVDFYGTLCNDPVTSTSYCMDFVNNTHQTINVFGLASAVGGSPNCVNDHFSGKTYTCDSDNGTMPLYTAGSGFLGGVSTFAQLPSASLHTGEWRTITDSTAITTEGQNCAGTGTVIAAVFSNGTVWKCF